MLFAPWGKGHRKFLKMDKSMIHIGLNTQIF